VSIPAIPGRPKRRSQSSSERVARKFDDSVGSARSTQPRAAGVVVSTSSSLAPTLPICGKVKVMI
jgi:hypothetical protein